MLFRLGYAAMTLNLEKCSPSGTVTITNFNRLPDRIRNRIIRISESEFEIC